MAYSTDVRQEKAVDATASLGKGHKAGLDASDGVGDGNREADKAE